MKPNDPPVALFAFKRPAHLQKALEAIFRSFAHLGRELPLYIYCDAAREKKEEELVEKTREVARMAQGAHLIFREKNCGFRNITDAITELCDRYGKVIVIEDDVLIAPDFLPFMCSALDAYVNDNKVFMISGFMYFAHHLEEPATFFLPAPFIWGWATWKRAWDHFSWDCLGWATFLANKKNRYLYDCLGSFPFSKGLRKTMEGKWSSWATRWMYAMAKERGLTLYPYQSLVWNCGCGGGTHGKEALDATPLLGEREFYIHGNLQYEDFMRPRLSPEVSGGKKFPKNPQIHRKALIKVAKAFLQERLTKEKKKRFRLYLRLWKIKLTPAWFLRLNY